MARRKLRPAQERFWNRLTGNHNRRVREQIEYMRQNGTLSAEEYEYLSEQSYVVSEGEIWRLIIDHIRVSTMRDFHTKYHAKFGKSERKRTKKTRK